MLSYEHLKAKFPHASESFLRRNAGCVGPSADGVAASERIGTPSHKFGATNAPSAVPVTTDEDKLNKTEKRWLEVLRSEHHDWIGIQCLALKLGHDCRYYPDLWTCDTGRLTAWEVKGFMRDDALVKLRVAARMFPFIRFVVVRWLSGEWKLDEVKP